MPPLHLNAYTPSATLVKKQLSMVMLVQSSRRMPLSVEFCSLHRVIRMFEQFVKCIKGSLPPSIESPLIVILLLLYKFIGADEVYFCLVCAQLHELNVARSNKIKIDADFWGVFIRCLFSSVLI